MWLVWKLNTGSRDALRIIYKKYKDELLSLAFSLLGDINTAEDVVHDIFVSFAGKAGSFRLTGSLKSYLSICVANAARDHYRRKSKQDVGLDEAVAHSSNEMSPDKRAEFSERTIQLNEHLSHLDFEQRSVVVLHLHHGMTFRKIAEQQNKSIHTIHSRYRYGLDKLRNRLNGKLDL